MLEAIPPPVNPCYGSIKDLCEDLGYGSTDKASNRYYRDFSNKTRKFRKTYFGQDDSWPVPTTFPIYYNTPEILECTSEFLDSHQELFEKWDDDFQQSSWLSKPENRRSLVFYLGKLIATQEFEYRRNMLQKYKVKSAVTKQEEETKSHTTISSPAIMAKDLHNDASETAKTSSSTIVQRKAAKEATVKNRNFFSEDDFRSYEEENAYLSKAEFFASDLTKKNIAAHLDLIYPRTNEEEKKIGYDWLLAPYGVWPRQVYLWTYRYLHDHNTYVYDNSTEKSTKEFITALKSRVGLERPCTEDEDSRILTKVKKYLSATIKKWNFAYRDETSGTHCLLEQKNGSLVKTVAFEKAWKQRRDEWNIRFQDGSSHDPEDLQVGEKRETLNPQRTHREKEASQDKTPPHGTPTPAQTGNRTSSQSRTPASFRLNAPIASMHGLVESVSVHKPLVKSTSSAQENSLKRKRSTASMMSPRPEKTTRTSISREASITSFSAVPLNLGAHSSETSSFWDFGAAIEETNLEQQPVPTSTANYVDLSGVVENIDAVEARMSEHSELHSSSNDLGGPSSFYPERTLSETPRTLMIKNEEYTYTKPAKSTNTKEVLRFVVEEAKGSLNLEDYIPTKQVDKASLEAMFCLVSVRRRDRTAPIARLVFKQNWEDKVSFSVGRDDDESTWQKLKAKLKGNFQYSREEGIEKGDFKVIIKCESETTHEVPASAQEEDDDENEW